MSRNHKNFGRGLAPAGRGVTLVELLVSLAMLAVLSTAVATLLAGAGHTNQYVNSETDALAQVENAYRRILDMKSRCDLL
jgi:prepilin-type N-terminal cleavage/methylation domain-containing protein